VLVRYVSRQAPERPPRIKRGPCGGPVEQHNISKHSGAQFNDPAADVKPALGGSSRLPVLQAEIRAAHEAALLAKQTALDDFIEKLIVERGHIDQAIVLVNNQTDANWFHRLCSIATAVAFTRGRIGFYNDAVECGSPPTGSVFCYIGDATERFHDTFQDDCLVLRSGGCGR
jgi:hypothetical protein